MTVTTLPETTDGSRARTRWCLGTRLVVAATLAWAAFLLLHLALSGRWWPWLLVELLPPFVLVVVPVALLAVTPLAARPVRWPMAALQVAALVLGGAMAGLGSGGGDAATTPANAVKVFSWNTDYWDQADAPDRFYAYLRAQRADVYLLQEYLNFTDGPIKIDDLARIRAEFPGYQVAVASEVITISRLPIVASYPMDASSLLSPADGSAPPPGAPWRDYYTTKALRTDVRIGDRVVSLYNVHLAVQVDTQISPFKPDFYRFVRGQFHRREAQLRTLRADVSANKNPVLVAGDFNSTSWMRDLTSLCGLLTCHDPVDPRFVPTSWGAYGLPRLWRLDWAMSRGDVAVSGYRFVPSKGLSDHLAQTLSLSAASSAAS